MSRSLVAVRHIFLYLSAKVKFYKDGTRGHSEKLSRGSSRLNLTLGRSYLVTESLTTALLRTQTFAKSHSVHFKNLTGTSLSKVYTSSTNFSHEFCYTFRCSAQTADRVSGADSLINAHIYSPQCRYTKPVPAHCDCGGWNSCGRLSFGRRLYLKRVDTAWVFKCFDNVNRFATLSQLLLNVSATTWLNSQSINQSSFISGMTERKPAMHKSNTHIAIVQECSVHTPSLIVLFRCAVHFSSSLYCLFTVFCWLLYRLIDWFSLIYWVNDWLINYVLMVDWLIDWQIDWLIHSFIHSFTHSFTHSFIHSFIHSLMIDAYGSR